MSRRRAAISPTKGAMLHGSTPAQVRDASIRVRHLSKRESAERARVAVTHAQAIAADPLLYELAQLVDEWTTTPDELGGRPRAHPTWAVLLIGWCVPCFGSKSAAARNLADPGVWSLIVKAALPNLPPDAAIPLRAPTRDQYHYLQRTLAPHTDKVTDALIHLSARRVREVGLANTTGKLSRLDTANVLRIDGKVFSSPLRLLITERTNPVTGEIKPIREDPARAQYMEGGKEMVWGIKFAIASIRGHLPGHRVVTGIQHVPHDDGRGEAGAMVDLAKAAWQANPGILALVADGALRGKHVAELQTATDMVTISPARRKDRKHGGIRIGDHYYAAKPLPNTAERFPNCTHDLWAAGGAIHERLTTADGTATYQPIDRLQLRRQGRKTGRYKKFLTCRIHCDQTGDTHIWSESLTPLATDGNFNRAEYLRARCILDDDYAHVYGMRNDAESLNAQLEHAFHKNRIPAWGLTNQTLTVAFTAFAFNSWALHAWQQELARQHPPPEQAA